MRISERLNKDEKVQALIKQKAMELVEELKPLADTYCLTYGDYVEFCNALEDSLSVDLVLEGFYQLTKDKIQKYGSIPVEDSRKEWASDVVRLKHPELNILYARQYSTHNDDFFLAVVLVKTDREYVTWLYNSDIDSFNTGKYYPLDNDGMQKAIDDYNHRGKQVG